MKSCKRLCAAPQEAAQARGGARRRCFIGASSPQHGRRFRSGSTVGGIGGGEDTRGCIGEAGIPTGLERPEGLTPQKGQKAKEPGERREYHEARGRKEAKEVGLCAFAPKDRTRAACAKPSVRELRSLG